VIYWRCKCSEHEYYESGMPPRGCEICTKCGSTMGTGKNFHLEPEEHEWEIKFDPNTGEPYEICKKCYNRKDRLVSNHLR
jgi:hypothetical protein